MGMEIITGYTGVRHITPGMDAAVWRSIYGSDMYIVNEGNLCAGSMPTINEFTILDGVVDMQGHMGYGTQESLAIDTCATGYKRIDLICCRYTHDNTSLIDNMEYIVIKGEEVASPATPAVPTYNTGIIDAGATIVDFPLYQIDLSGSTVTFTQLAEIKELGKTYTAGPYLKMVGNAIEWPAISIATQLANFTLSNNSLTNKELYTIPKNGIVFGTITASFSANTTGARFLNPIDIDGSSWTGLGAATRVGSAPTGTTALIGSFTRGVIKNHKIGARFFQNSGSNLTVSDIYLTGYLIPYTS